MVAVNIYSADYDLYEYSHFTAGVISNMRFLNKIYSNIGLSKVLNIRKRLIFSTSFLVLLLILVNLVLFYIFAMHNYIEQLKDSNESLIKQIGFFYEMVLKNVKNFVFKTTLTDMELQDLVQNYDNSIDSRNEIFRKLYNIALSNEYIQSIYLYIPEFNQVFSTFNNTEKISPIERFSDKLVFNNIKDKSYYCLEPRTIEYNNVKKLIFSIVSSIPLYSQQNTAFLVVNVNLDQLRYDITLKFKKSQDLNFYVINSNKSIIITQGKNNRLGDILTSEPANRISYKGLWGNILLNNITITSIYDSRFLKWKFILEKSIDISSTDLMGHLEKFVWITNVSIFLLTCGIIILIILIIIFTSPVNRVLVNYSEELWKDFITDSIHLTDETKEQLMGNWLKHINAKFGTIVLRIEDNSITNRVISYYKMSLKEIMDTLGEKNTLKAQVVIISKNTIAVVVCYPNARSFKSSKEQHVKLAEMIYEKINPLHRDVTYLGISTIKEHINLIPLAYQECMKMFGYKLICDGSHLLSFSTIRDMNEDYEYPYHIEKQLLNNLAIGNMEACTTILEEFFSLFKDSNTRVSDAEIISSVYRLKESILKNLNHLLSVTRSIECFDISNARTLDEIKASLGRFIEDICFKAIQRDNDEKRKLYNTVISYIDKHFMQPDISLDKIAEMLNLNRNYISKIVKEITGYNFTDYVNGKRIALAKKLLRERGKTINDIAAEVGFNYSYYFIRIFKSFEGITPGQYREKMS
jgi:two-component system response regulator YesN